MSSTPSTSASVPATSGGSASISVSTTSESSPPTTTAVTNSSEPTDSVVSTATSGECLAKPDKPETETSSKSPEVDGDLLDHQPNEVSSVDDVDLADNTGNNCESNKGENQQLRGRKPKRSGGSTTDSLSAKKLLKSTDGTGKKTSLSDGEDSERYETISVQKEVANAGSKDDSEMKPTTLASSTPAYSDSPLKVPPLRIVIHQNSANNVATSSSNSTLQSNLLASTSSDSGNEPLTTVTSTNKYPYVLNCEPDSVNDSTDCTAVISASGVNTPATAITSHRITRSSQRVALKQQKNHNHSDNEDQTPNTTRKKKNRGANQCGSQNSSVSNNNNNSLGSSNNNQNENDDNSSSSTASTTTNTVTTNCGQRQQQQQPNCVDSVPNQYHYDPSKSSYRQYMWIRDQVSQRRQEMSVVSPRLPEAYDTFLLNQRTYMLRGKPIPEHLAKRKPPKCLPIDSPLHKLWLEQEEKRYKMRLQHQVEKERLQVTKESQILRVYNNAARLQQNQAFPLSVCSYLKDEELYNKVEFETDHSIDNVIIAQIKEDDPRFMNDGPSAMSGMCRMRYTNRMLNQNLNSLEDKWSATQREMFNRHTMEAQTLNIVQKMNWRSKMQEIGDETFTVDSFVSTVEVTDAI